MEEEIYFNSILGQYISFVGSGIKFFEGTKKYVATGSLLNKDIVNALDITFNSRPSRANMEFRKNDVICARMKNTKKILLIDDSTKDFIFSTGFVGLRVNNLNKLMPKYVFYWLNSYYFQEMKNNLCNGSTQESISIENLKKIPINIPEIHDQKTIISFLDKKTVEIDENIAKNKELIALLQEKKIALIHHTVTKGIDSYVDMKETTIPWADNIPKHWKIYKGKNILIELKRNVKIDDDVITCFRDGEVTLRTKRREDGFTMSDKEIGYQGIEKNDLVVHGMDGFAGAIGISDSRGKGSPVLIVLNSNQNKKYLMYYLRNLAYNNVFLALSTGIRVRSCDLRWEKLANLLYLIPPLDEQEQIANYLDENINHINKIIEKIQEHISLLEEYKTSLIHNVVTGNIDVRD